MTRRWPIIRFGLLLVLCLASGGGWAAETSDPVPMTKTLLVLKTDSGRPLEVRTTFQERPPTITLTFPSRRVVGSLPERSTIGKGVIQSIAARYERAARAAEGQRRFLQALEVVLAAPYAFRVRMEPGRVVVEIDHPASVTSASFEVGLGRGTILVGIGKQAVSQRFRAMQDAMALASSASWTIQTPSAPNVPLVAETPSAAAVSGGTPSSSAREPSGPASIPPPSAASPLSSDAWTVMWLLAPAALAAFAILGLWWVFRRELASAAERGAAARERRVRLPSGVILIDQLVWRAFERQGYQLVLETDLVQPLTGTCRLIVKEGSKSALMFVGNGPFFERQTVERFVQAMQGVDVEQGFLVASGAFTVPAQRFAKEHRVTLIGREQLTELLSAGAGSEYFTKQLEQSRVRFEEAKETLQRYTDELDTLRRQRNEASWRLGEEREKAAAIERQVAELEQRVRRQEGEIQQREQEAAGIRKHWEESEWYLGESRARIRHLEAQLAALQEAVARADSAERERDELRQRLLAEEARRVSLEQQGAELQQQAESAAGRMEELRRELLRLKQALSALRAYGERRQGVRAGLADARVEVFNGGEEPLFSGAPRDVSADGIGLETEQELPAQAVRVRLSLSGRDPIESKGLIMWQRLEELRRYRSGCRLLELSADSRFAIEQLVRTWRED
jgi:hypothetical protein